MDYGKTRWMSWVCYKNKPIRFWFRSGCRSRVIGGIQTVNGSCMAKVYALPSAALVLEMFVVILSIEMSNFIPSLFEKVHLFLKTGKKINVLLKNNYSAKSCWVCCSSD